MPDYEQAVFISYAWGEDTDEREAIVNQLDQSLQKRGLKIVRDKRDLGYKGSIRNFMERVGESNCVIVVISDQYLRSKNCMYELVEIAENKQFADRIFPIILDDAKIYDWRGQANYLDYWEQEKSELAERIRGLKDLSNLTGLTEQLNDYDRFRDEISKLMNTLKDMNSLSSDLLRNADFQPLYDKLVERMSSTWTMPKPHKEEKPMDPATLAATVTGILAPFLAKMGESMMEEVGVKLPEKIGKLWEAISNRFKGNPIALVTANDLAKNAEDTANQEAFALQLKKALKEDTNFANMLADLLEDAQGSISNVGDGTVATGGSVAVGKIQVGGDMSGNIAIGNNNQITDRNKGRKQ